MFIFTHYPAFGKEILGVMSMYLEAATNAGCLAYNKTHAIDYTDFSYFCKFSCA